MSGTNTPPEGGTGTPPPEGGAGGPEGTPPGKDGDADHWRAEAAKHAKAARETQAALEQLRQEIEDGKRSEQEKAEKRVTDAEAKATAAEERAAKAERRLAIFQEAARQGADPEVAEALIAANPGRYTLTINDDGTIEGVDAAVTQLLTDKPQIKVTGDDGKPPRFPPGPGGDGGPRGGEGNGQLTREDLDRMTPAQIVKANREGRLDAIQGLTKT